ncbi:MAG: acetyl-CoA carboxylase biotin carboxylase subunit [Candidatus Eiseniibacteriota bacterium]|nr:MAG: acetyl-CoA carboxylase biotin carboxylase subunit [Candidatus Eisenbacteria bacterium]
MLKRVLVANRGEIAVRLIRGLRETGTTAIAIFSDADRDSLHVRLADEAYRIGPPPSEESYLKLDAIVSLAKKVKADAVHPGYGFLAENEDFPARCKANGLVFIGPSSRAIKAMGNKLVSRKTAVSASVPIIPGATSPARGIGEARASARGIGYPIMLKAAAGGGGKGLRIVKEEKELESAIRLTQGEARAAFGNDEVYVEKYISRPRHIEIQILADERGNCVYLGERECSIQRRHQKVIEETPSVIVTPELRKQMGEAAVRIAKAVGYTNAGTVEFIVDEKRNFYFLEMNTRLQVEHPVTELVTGIDLVKEQLRVASSKKLSFKQEDVRPRGHAIECRIYAEDPYNSFLPSAGKILRLRLPEGPGIRNDAGIFQGCDVSVYYDPLLAKLVVWGSDRKEAIERTRRALSEYLIDGVATTIPFHRWIMEQPEFGKGDIHADFIDAKFSASPPVEKAGLLRAAIIAAALDVFEKERKIVLPKTEEGKTKPSAWKLFGRLRSPHEVHRLD